MKMLLQRTDHQKCHGYGNRTIIMGYNIYNISCTHVGRKMNINLCLIFRLVCHLAEKVCEGHEECQQLEERGLHSEHRVSQQDSETPES